MRMDRSCLKEFIKKGNKDGKWVEWNENGSVREVIEY